MQQAPDQPTDLAVPERDAAGGVGGGQLPGRVHHDDVKLGAGYEAAPVVGGDVGVDGDAVRRHLPLGAVQVVDRTIPPVQALHALLALLGAVLVSVSRGS